MNWSCPYCSRPQVGTDSNIGSLKGPIYITNVDRLYGELSAIKCLSVECGMTSLHARISKFAASPNGAIAGDAIQDWRLWPQSSSKPQPQYIPAPLREDYEEACLIRDLSPKASAALSRRCLQGMIRDFCGIAKGSLDKEIKELRRQIDEGVAPRDITPDSVDGIDHVRSVGNIGAHMERDINLIIEIEPAEAQILIGLIETLFEEWYVARHRRAQKFAALAAVAEGKRAQIEEGRATLAEAKQLPSPIDP